MDTSQLLSLYLDLVERVLNGLDSGPVGRELAREARDAQATNRVQRRELRELAERILSQRVPGDWLFQGAGEGVSGECLWLRAILKAHGDSDRRILIVGSIDLPEVREPSGMRAKLDRIGLLDEQVELVPEDFDFDGTPITSLADRLALVRLGGENAFAVTEALRRLYPRINLGGCVIIGDLGLARDSESRRAIDAFRQEWGILDACHLHEDGSLSWRKSREGCLGPRSRRMVGGAGAQVENSPPPFWSVIIPLYERTKYLGQCLDSVVNQAPGPEEMEIVVVDDASPTDPRDLVEQLGGGRVGYHRNPTNVGLYPSVNSAILRARGRWIHVLHDDDWVKPGFHARFRQVIQSVPETVGAVCCRYENHDQTTKFIETSPQLTETPTVLGRVFLAILAQGNPLTLPAVVVRRFAYERVGLYREDLPFTADWEFHARLALSMDWAHIPDVLACYRRHPETQTSALTRQGLAIRDLAATLKIFARSEMARRVPQALREGQVRQARKALRQALQQSRNGLASLARGSLLAALMMDQQVEQTPEFSELLADPGMACVIRDSLMRELL